MHLINGKVGKHLGPPGENECETQNVLVFFVFLRYAKAYLTHLFLGFHSNYQYDFFMKIRPMGT